MKERWRVQKRREEGGRSCCEGGSSAWRRGVESDEDSHLDLSVWWNKLRRSTLSSDVTSEAPLFSSSSPFFSQVFMYALISLLTSPPLADSLPSLSLPLLPFSLRVSVLSVSDTQWIREYLAAPLSDLSSSPAAPSALGPINQRAAARTDAPATTTTTTPPLPTQLRFPAPQLRKGAHN